MVMVMMMMMVMIIKWMIMVKIVMVTIVTAMVHGYESDSAADNENVLAMIRTIYCYNKEDHDGNNKEDGGGD